MITIIEDINPLRPDLKVVDIEIRPYMYNTMSEDRNSPKRHIFLRFEYGLYNIAETDTVNEAEQLKTL